MWVLALALMAAAPQAHAGIDIHAAGGRVDVRATAAPLADVLDRLSKQTGMKVVFEGSPERQLVTATLVGRTPAEAVLGILDGLGLNYALSMDPTGKQVQTLLISGPAPVSSGAPPAAQAPAAGRTEERPATSWDDDEGEEESEAEPNKAGADPFVPQQGTNGRPVQRKEAPAAQAAPAQQPATPSPSPQNPGGEWVQPTPQPLTFPTPAPSATPAAEGGDDFFDDQ